MKRSGGVFDVERKRSRIAQIERDASHPDFWNDNAKAQGVLKEKAQLEATVARVEQIRSALLDVRALFELATEADDAATHAEVDAQVRTLEATVEKLELGRMLSGENDSANCFMDINAGAGGTESMDWAAMLLRMYTRYAESKGWTVEINDYVAGEEAGVKNVSIRVAGENAYGYLKAETGVHRLVRISPFDGNTVAMQNERSQHANRDMAWKILRARLFDLERKKRDKAREEVEAQKKDIAFGSQIRSYVLAPYQLVKDLRTGVETGNVDAVLDGELEDFITAQLLGVKNPARALPE